MKSMSGPSLSMLIMQSEIQLILSWGVDGSWGGCGLDGWGPLRHEGAHHLPAPRCRQPVKVHHIRFYFSWKHFALYNILGASVNGKLKTGNKQEIKKPCNKNLMDFILSVNVVFKTPCITRPVCVMMCWFITLKIEKAAWQTFELISGNRLFIDWYSISVPMNLSSGKCQHKMSLHDVKLNFKIDHIA